MQFSLLRNRTTLALAGLALLRCTTIVSAAAPPADIPCAPKAVIRFATPHETADALAVSDDYLTRLSLRDRQIRMHKSGDVTTQEFAQFLAHEALEWQPDQIERVHAVAESLAARIRPLNLALPETVLLGLTSGREEDNAAYTRGHTIFLPRSKVAGSTAGLERLLAHELFHVLSRHNAELRRRLYAIVGFKPCGEIMLPEALSVRSLHNPDAPVCDYAIDLRHEGASVAAVPILLVANDRPGAAPPSNLFRALDFRLLAIEQVEGRWQPKLVAGEPLLLDPQANESYHAQVGRNTAYIIHPEEILADNFMHLVFGTKNLPNPAIIEQLQRAVQGEPAK